MGLDLGTRLEYQPSPLIDETNPLEDNPNMVPGAGYYFKKEVPSFNHNNVNYQSETLWSVFDKNLLHGDTLNYIRIFYGLGVAAASAAGVDLDFGDMLQNWDHQDKDILSVWQTSRVGQINSSVIEYGKHTPGQTLGSLTHTETNVVVKQKIGLTTETNVYDDEYLKYLTVRPELGESVFKEGEPVKVFGIDSQTFAVITHINKTVISEVSDTQKLLHLPENFPDNLETITKNQSPQILSEEQFKVDIIKVDPDGKLVPISSVNAMPEGYKHSFGTKLAEKSGALLYRYTGENFYFVSKDDGLTYYATPEGFKQLTGFVYKPQLRDSSRFVDQLDLVRSIKGHEVHIFPVDNGIGGYTFGIWGLNPDVSGGGLGYTSPEQIVFPFGVKNVTIDNIDSFPKYDTDGIQTHSFTVVSYTQSGARMFAVLKHDSTGKALEYAIVKGNSTIGSQSNFVVDISVPKAQTDLALEYIVNSKDAINYRLLDDNKKYFIKPINFIPLSQPSDTNLTLDKNAPRAGEPLYRIQPIPSP